MSPIILDTNVVSEMQRSGEDGPVASWLARQDEADLFTTAVTVSELAVGIAALPAGRRRAELDRWLHHIVYEHFADRILPFDAAARLVFGQLVARARSIGRPPGVGDAQIAAIAAHHLMPVATRNVRDFAHFGLLAVVNPWEPA